MAPLIYTDTQSSPGYYTRMQVVCKDMRLRNVISKNVNVNRVDAMLDAISRPSTDVSTKRVDRKTPGCYEGVPPRFDSDLGCGSNKPKDDFISVNS